MKKNKYIIYLFVIIYIIFTFNTLSLANNKNTTEAVEKINNIEDNRVENKKNTDENQNKESSKKISKVQIIANGIYEIGVGQNKVIEVKNSYKYSGANVQISTKNNTVNQKVSVKYIGEGYYTIKFIHSGMYLDVADGKTKNGTNVWQCRENESDAQKWIIRENEDGKYNIISKCSNTYLTVANGIFENGTNIEINEKKNDNSQNFIFYKCKEEKGNKTIENGIYEIGIGVNSNKVLEVSNSYKYSGANVHIYEKNNAKSQKVQITYIGDGYYTIKFMHSGMYLDVANGETKNGTNVWQCRENGSDAQKWIIRKNERGKYNIISKCSNTYLTVENGKDENGTNIEINGKKDDNSQEFVFYKYTEKKESKTINSGVYEIGITTDASKVVEVANAYKYSGANVRIYTRNKGLSQKVKIVYIGDGYYTIKFMHSGMYLDVANGETKNGTNVWQCRENGSDAQKWIIRKNEKGKYNIISKCSNTYLTIENGKNGNGTNIEINEKKNDDSQDFIFNEYKEEKGSKTIENGIYEIKEGKDLNKVIEVANTYKYSGANVQIYEKNNAKSQKVQITYIGDGYYTIKFMHSGMYLDVADGKTNNGTNVWQCRENGSDAQKWIIRKNEKGKYNIISKCSNTYLTIENGKNENGTNIEINEKKNDDSQDFIFNEYKEEKGSKTIESGIYEIKEGKDLNKVIEVANTYKYSGANVQIYERNNAKSQKVQITYIGDGYYTIKFMHSGMYLDVANGETKNGTNVWQCRENGSDAQKWIIRKNEKGKYNIISKCSNTYLTIENGKNENGTNIEINEKKNDDSQDFIFNEYKEEKGSKTIENGIYEIKEGKDLNKVIEVANTYKYSGANVQIYERNNAKSQKVQITYIGDGYYTIKFMHSGMYLDVANGETKNGTNVWQCRENGSDAQKWIIRKNEKGKYNIISKCSNTYLTIENGKNENSTNIEINEKKNDDSQDFIFNEYKEEKGSKTIENGVYEIEYVSSKVIDVLDASILSGANVQLYERNYGLCQRVEIKYVGDGYYTIKFMHSGMYLDVADGKTNNGTNVWQCRENGSDAQKWIIRKNESGDYNIISKCSNTYLTVENGKDENGANIEINEKKNNKSQNFKLNNKTELKGIDVSSHQGNVKWEDVKKSNIDFAIIRCGYGQDLLNQDDKKFTRNISECERLGIPYGVYIYSYALDETAALSEANHVLRLISGHNPKLGIWFDMEDADGYKRKNGMPSNEKLVNICITFCEKIKQEGYNVGIYASLSWLRNQLNDSKLDVYDKWVAQWAIGCTYNKRYVMWQYTDKGTVEGIDGYVDMNKYYM